MGTKFVLTVTALFFIVSAIGQKSTIELTFTAIDSAAYIQLDSIKVMNRTQGGDTVLYYPDTVLVLDYQVGISETNIDTEGFQVFQNYPNPVANQTTISLYVPDKDNVILIVTDILGRVIIKTDRVLDKGVQSFRFTPGSENLYFFTAQWRGNSSSIKMIQTASYSLVQSAIEYTGNEALITQLKASKNIQGFSFNLGDELLYIGYIDTLQSGMSDAPEENQSYTFQFATNIPCPGTPTVTYEGQVYNTIQIFNQCWLKENLNVGSMIYEYEEMEDNGVMEKYCYDNEPDSCAKYGGLYQWNEMMQYNTQQGTQGICPPDWHLPIDEEWKVLEGGVDSQYGIGDPEWDNSGDSRGFDAGANMKTASGWYDNGNGTDLFGFSALPGGCRCYGSFYNLGGSSYWWLATEYSSNYAWTRTLRYYNGKVTRSNDYDKDTGFSVRCVRD